MWHEKNQASCTHVLIGKCEISEQLDNGADWVITTRSLLCIYLIRVCLHASDHNKNMQCLNLHYGMMSFAPLSRINNSRLLESKCGGRVNTMQINSNKPLNLACSSVSLSRTKRQSLNSQNKPNKIHCLLQDMQVIANLHSKNAIDCYKIHCFFPQFFFRFFNY